VDSSDSGDHERRVGRGAHVDRALWTMRLLLRRCSPPMAAEGLERRSVSRFRLVPLRLAI
jgi:hypothetical protein